MGIWVITEYLLKNLKLVLKEGHWSYLSLVLLIIGLDINLFLMSVVFVVFARDYSKLVRKVGRHLIYKTRGIYNINVQELPKELEVTNTFYNLTSYIYFAISLLGFNFYVGSIIMSIVMTMLYYPTHIFLNVDLVRFLGLIKGSLSYRTLEMPKLGMNLRGYNPLAKLNMSLVMHKYQLKNPIIIKVPLSLWGINKKVDILKQAVDVDLMREVNRNIYNLLTGGSKG